MSTSPHDNPGSARSSAGRTSRRTLAQLVALVSGAVFLLVGIAGFVPGLTTSYDDLGFAGHDSMAMLIGIFMVSVLHNVVHLLFGIVGVAAARTWTASRAYLTFGGAIYLVLWIYGLVVDHNSAANFVPLNTADNWLHLGLCVVMVAAGLALGRTAASGRATAAGTTGASGATGASGVSS